MHLAVLFGVPICELSIVMTLFSPQAVNIQRKEPEIHPRNIRSCEFHDLWIEITLCKINSIEIVDSTILFILHCDKIIYLTTPAGQTKLQ